MWTAHSLKNVTMVLYTGSSEVMTSMSEIVVREADVDGKRSRSGWEPMMTRRTEVFPAPVVPTNMTRAYRCGLRPAPPRREPAEDSMRSEDFGPIGAL